MGLGGLDTVQGFQGLRLLELRFFFFPHGLRGLRASRFQSLGYGVCAGALDSELSCFGESGVLRDFRACDVSGLGLVLAGTFVFWVIIDSRADRREHGLEHLEVSGVWHSF